MVLSGTRWGPTGRPATRPAARTPYLDRLASEGVTFARAYTPTPLCTPARAALFTGRFPHSNGLTANTQHPECPTPFLGAGERMLFEHLGAAGYRCGYAGKWHLNAGDEGAEARRRRTLADWMAATDDPLSSESLLSGALARTPLTSTSHSSTRGAPPWP